MALADEMETHFGESVTIYTDDKSPINLDTLINNAQPESHLYICGPKGMIEAARCTRSRRC